MAHMQLVIPQLSPESLVTLCVPARNAAGTIRRTLDSLLAQDYDHKVILVCDNLSDDNTATIVADYVNRGVKYILNPNPGSAESNWNYALEHCTSPYVAIYHADDVYTPSMVSRQVAFLLTNPAASSVFTMSQRIDEADRPIRMGAMQLPPEVRHKALLDFPTFFNAVLKYTDFISTPTLLTRRATLEAVGNFDTRFGTAADLDLWIRMAAWRPIGVIDEPLHLYRISSQQGSAQMEQTRTYEAHFFGVMDSYLTRSDVRQIVDARAVEYYEMQRSIDRVRRAMTCILQDRTDEASSLLQEARPWEHLATAYNRPYRAGQLAIGTGLWLSMRLGLARVAGNLAQRMYRVVIKRRQSPTVED